VSWRERRVEERGREEREERKEERKKERREEIDRFCYKELWLEERH
jgi:hypothetical protein